MSCNDLAFLLIKYALDTESRKVMGWDKERYNMGPSCITYLAHTRYINVSYSEDCTFVDIYTPGDVNSTSGVWNFKLILTFFCSRLFEKLIVV